VLHRDLVSYLAGLSTSPFGPNSRDLAKDALAGSPDPRRGAVALSTPEDAFLLLWRCTATAAAGNNDEGAVGEFVATLPVGVPRGARPTSVVVEEMLAGAKRRVIALGYAFTAAGGTIDLLSSASASGVDVLIICDREQGGRAAIERAWPGFVAQPTIYENAASNDVMSKMHSKMLLVDNNDLLVTSANFTYHGMSGNIEFGVRLRDAQSAKAAEDFVKHLIETGAVVQSDSS